MKRALQAVALTGAASALVLGSAAAASAANPPGTGQPSQSCEDFLTGSGALPVPGFNTAGFTHAADVYAGSPGTPSALHARSGAAVSQYDVACFQVSHH